MTRAIIFATSIIIGLTVSGCGNTRNEPLGSMPPVPSLMASPGGYRVLYRFLGRSDGFTPSGGLIAVEGSLYGTTVGGGLGCKTSELSGCGTVFNITISGRKRVLYDLHGGTDGAYPYGTLFYRDGQLYGTTASGGAGNCAGITCGTIFAVHLIGGERILHRFEGARSGGLTHSGLSALGGLLYGTTPFGGPAKAGTVFSSTRNGTFSEVYAFKGESGGDGPNGPLLASNRMLFGTTANTGSGACCGTVFAVSPTGIERVLYRFKQGYVDGALPQGGLLEVRGRLFGTTTLGGYTSSAHCGTNDGCGTVFSVTQTGQERIVYRFKGGGVGDGSSPTGTLIWDGTEFYGITGGGGAATAACFDGCGTIFKLTPSGQEQVLHRFQGGRDGAGPSGGLLFLNGTLYGVTVGGGGTGCGGMGCGTVFALTP